MQLLISNIGTEITECFLNHMYGVLAYTDVECGLQERRRSVNRNILFEIRCLNRLMKVTWVDKDTDEQALNVYLRRVDYGVL